MKFGIFFVLAFFAARLFADLPQVPFSPKSAADFAASKPDYAAVASGLAERAMKLYEAKDFKGANENYLAGRFLSFVGGCKEEIDGAFVAYVLSTPELLDEAELISPEDDTDSVIQILNSIWKKYPDDFKAFANLALAVAIVFDQPPPDAWPHNQVSKEVLPRKFSEPTEAFKMWVDDRRKGRLMLQPEKLSAEELKFLVATIAPSEDRAWAQRSVSTNVAGIAKLYSGIKYDNARLGKKAFSWEGSTYSLQDIKEKGGICVDQSYFTSEVAKAKGLPAFIFSGAGSDGFHAWVGYMQKSGKWNFSVGRYASGRFVTGTTIDPQTWQTATSHSLERLREGFRRNQKYKASELHTAFAQLYFINKNNDDAIKAATEAIKSDARNFLAWKILYEANVDKGDTAGAEKVCGNAIRAFAHSPDNDAYFRKIMLESLKAEGKRAEAKKLSNAFVIKNKAARPDLAMEFARFSLMSEIEGGDAKNLKTSYKKLFGVFKGDLGMTLEGIVIPVLQKLSEEGKTDKIQEIVAQTRQIIKASKDETIESNFDKALSAFSK